MNNSSLCWFLTILSVWTNPFVLWGWSLLCFYHPFRECTSGFVWHCDAKGFLARPLESVLVWISGISWVFNNSFLPERSALSRVDPNVGNVFQVKLLRENKMFVSSLVSDVRFIHHYVVFNWRGNETHVCYFGWNVSKTIVFSFILYTRNVCNR